MPNSQLPGMGLAMSEILPERDTNPYSDVRALERGLALIEALAEHGWLGPSELERRTGINRTTIYRLLATLENTGFVVRDPQRAKFFLSAKMQIIGSSVRAGDEFAMLVRDPLNELVEEIKWPSDFAVLDRGQLMIVGCTHSLTTMSFFRSSVGQTRPVVRSSLGRAMLAAMSADELAQAVNSIMMAGGSDAEEIGAGKSLENALEVTRMRGYALSLGEADDRTSAIALPVLSCGKVIGAINIIFFRSTFRIEWADRYLHPLRTCVAKVEAALNNSHYSLIGASGAALRNAG